MKKIILVITMLAMLCACAKNEAPKNNSTTNTNTAKEETTNTNKKTNASNEIVNNEEDVLYSYVGENDDFDVRVIVTPVTEDYLKTLADEKAGTSSDELQKIMESNPTYKVNVYLTYTGDSLTDLQDVTDPEFHVTFTPTFDAERNSILKEDFVKILTGKEPLIKDLLIPENVSSDLNEKSIGKIVGSSATMKQFNFEIELKSK